MLTNAQLFLSFSSLTLDASLLHLAENYFCWPKTVTVNTY